MNAERLLNVAKALRESPDADKFTMAWFAHPCGTPACALGHYAFRTDLQDFLAIGVDQRGLMNTPLLYAAEPGLQCFVDHEEVHAHFGITFSEAMELFEWNGCGGAKTATEAADYIERFVAEHQNAETL